MSEKEIQSMKDMDTRTIVLVEFGMVLMFLAGYAWRMVTA